MKPKAKKIIAMLLLMAMFVGILPPASAEPQKMILSVDSVSGHAGSTVEVNIDLKNNPGVASISFWISYDSSVLELKAINYNTAEMEGVPAKPPLKNNPLKLLWISTERNCTVENVTFATLVFQIAESAPENYTADLTVTYDEDEIYNIDYDNVDTIVQNGYVKIGHDIEIIPAVEATCTEPGLTEGEKCSLCNEILVEQQVVPALGHKDGNHNGECDKCGKIMDGIAKMYTRSLSLSGNIAVNFYVVMDEGLTEEELQNVSMKFTLQDGTTSEMSYSDAKKVTKDGRDCAMFTCYVHATQMSQVITAVMCRNGEEGTGYTYSVKQYLDKMSGTADEKLQAVIDAMRAYGAASQIYFGKDTDNLVTDLTGATFADPGDLSAYTRNYTLINEELGITAKSATLVLFSETAIRVYFNLDSGCSMSDYAFTVTGDGGRTVEYTVNKGQKYIEIPNIGSTKLDEMFEVTVSKDNETALAISYGAFSYIGNKLSDMDENLRNVVKALYAYNKAAEAYVA